ncbi:hypothetical protein AVEN_145840-1 [Araneus ventricosus]|uniref:Uncharacterized protein n=1 Tax=Araneus ventricosus TaxID=182803 RepID=A0A4Y2RUK8_ARAVE|nr:hypothetical protein AVEN_145840-1 [Araneus ventricosus]
MNTGKTRRLKTMKHSKVTTVSKKSFLVRYLEAIISNTENIRKLNKQKSSEEKRTVIEKNPLVNDQEFQIKYYSNSYADQSNRREQAVDQCKRGEIKGMRRRPVSKSLSAHAQTTPKKFSTSIQNKCPGTLSLGDKQLASFRETK